jgi:hypothetical protein
MATPSRLTELSCPNCEQKTWVMDSDYRGIGGDMIPYSARPYECRACGHNGCGWTLLQQAPADFLLQPHSLYPMTQVEFDHWVSILKEHFPDCARPRKPCTPQEALVELERDAQANSGFTPLFQERIKEIKAKFGLD